MKKKQNNNLLNIRRISGGNSSNTFANLVRLMKSTKFVYSKLLALFLLCLLSYGLTLGMYIWQDDNAIMFKLQHVNEGAGNLGQGIYDRNTPYRGVIVPLVPLYYLFGIEPAGYFAVALLIYFFCAVTVYFLAKNLKNNEDFAFGAALIFAAGFVGGETLWRVYNSIHTVLNIILICWSLIFYIKAVKNTSIIKYLISLLLFLVAMETGYVRAHGIILLILGLELIYFFRSNFAKSLIRIIPFAIFYYFYYLHANASSTTVDAFLKKVIDEGKVEILFASFTTLKNIIIPDRLRVPDWLFIITLFLLLVWKRSRILWYSVIFMMQSYLTPYIHFQGEVFGSLHRYVTLSLVGLSVFFAELFDKLFKNKKLFYIAISIVVISHLYLINRENLRMLRTISFPARNFYTQLTQKMPDVPKGAAIYTDVAADSISNYQYANFFGVGSMPEMTAIAVHYGIDRYDLTLPATFNELLSSLKNKITTPDKIFTFYYDADLGLVNTTDQTKQALFSKTDDLIIDNLNSINLNYSSPVQLTLDIEAKIDHIDYHPENKTPGFDKYLKYLIDRHEYYQNVEATSSSQWKYSEINNAIDENHDTGWMAHRGHWHYNRNEYVVIDLKSPKDIGAVRIKFQSAGKAASNYLYQCSLDSKNWKDLKRIYRNVRNDSEKAVDILPESTCRYLRINIDDTANEDEPQFAEVEVVSSQFSDLNFTKADKIMENPFLFVSSENDESELLNYLNLERIPVKLCKSTDKREIPEDSSDCQTIQVSLNAKSKYSVIIPPSGTILKKVVLTTFPNINIDTSNISLHYLTYEELLEKGYIFDYSQN